MAFPIYNARQPGSDVVNEKLEQLIAMVGRQQEVILGKQGFAELTH